MALDQIVEGMQWQSDDIAAYLNTETGQVVSVNDDELAAAEAEDESKELSDWEAEAIAIARAILHGKDYLALPDRFEIDEYGMMERFASAADEAVRARLLRAIRGSGAFRYFKDTVAELGIAQEWYSFRHRAYGQIAAEWCRDHDIEYSPLASPMGGSDV